MDGKGQGVNSSPHASFVSVDFNAAYSLEGTPARRTRVQRLSQSGIRILTAEELMLRCAIVVKIEIGNKWKTIPGQVFSLASVSGSLFNYEIRVDERVLRANMGSIESYRPREERRLTTRVIVDLAASYTSNGRSLDGAHVVELSTLGLRLRTRESLGIHGMVKVDICVAFNRHVRIAGQIVHVAHEVGDTFEYGVKLLSDASEKNVLRGIVLAASVNRAK